MLNKIKQCIKLDWLKIKKQNTQVMQQPKTRKGRERERKKVTKSLGAFLLPHLGGTFPLSKPLNQRWGGKIETVQVWKEHEGFE